jgi:ABC-type nitrate/sulfonate/bicarbonate transport system substrate-binding protein
MNIETIGVRLFPVLAIAVFLVSCDETKPLRTVELKLNWQHGSDFLGYYVAAKQGYFAEEGLEVNIHALGDPTEARQVFAKVAAGEFHFSLAGGSLVDAQAEGLPLVAIANFIKLNPATLFARADSGIKTPADLAGHSIVIKNEYWRLSIANLLAQFDLSLDDVRQVPGGYDMQPFYDGKVEVWAGFIQDEPVRARLAGLDIVTLPFHEYGERTVALTVFTGRALLDSEPELAERFTRASLRGWRWAVENPAAAVDLMLEAQPELAPGREFHLAAFRASIPLLLPPGAALGEIDCENWRGHELLAGLPARDDTCTMRIYDAAFSGDSQ